MKSTASPEASAPQSAFIFIPDISGFTQFVTDTEVNHARHIVSELLSTILEANTLGLEVSEVEGDAILFYRFGKPPHAEELLSQVKSMFILFHQHLIKYDKRRICNCGACKTAHNLSLKFVAHYGDISINQVQQFKKLFGKDVIVAHRLLKNDIDSHEYALFTQNLTEACSSWSEAEGQAWTSQRFSEQEYDSGRVNFSYFHMDPLKAHIPPLTDEDYGLPGYRSKILESERIIKAPMDLIFNVLADVPWKTMWIPGTIPVEELNTQLTQSGQTHKCMANGPVIVGHDFHNNTNEITFTETDIQKSSCTVYTLQKLDPESTKVSATIFIPRNVIKKAMFSLFMKKKYQNVFETAWNNLEAYCMELHQQQKEHPFQIQLEHEPVVH